MKVLYISYDGILEPLGKSQVVSYLNKLSKKHEIILISYEKKEDLKNDKLFKSMYKDLKKSGICWHALTYHKSPTALATLYDITVGALFGLYLVVKNDVQIIHARSYVPSVMALVVKKIHRVGFIFDMRGFWADERVDGNLWKKNSNIYKVSKWFEKKFLLNADVVISLTHSAIEEMNKFPYLKNKKPKFEVITTCTDLELFGSKTLTNDSSNRDSEFILGYVGSVGVWYLFEEALLFYKTLKETIPNARLCIINKGGHDYINDCLHRMKIDKDLVTVETKDSLGVSAAMKLMSAGVFIIKPVFSKKASAPTKMGEFLGCGVPCVINNGIGDSADIIKNENVGVVLNAFDRNEMYKGVKELIKLVNDPDIVKRCVNAAKVHFSLDDGVKSYDKVYNSFEK